MCDDTLLARLDDRHVAVLEALPADDYRPTGAVHTRLGSDPGRGRQRTAGWLSYLARLGLVDRRWSVDSQGTYMTWSLTYRGAQLRELARERAA